MSTSVSNVLDLVGTNGATKTSSSTAATSTTKTTDTSATDRFLKLLVTQMQNQDPLNPMDNAQVTSQMAQISTVSGIQDLNTTVAGLNAQFTQLQAVQGASLVGHDVTLAGNKLDTTTTTGQGIGGFELGSAASSVKVTVKDGAGRVVDTLDLGAQPAGMNGFAWTAPVTGQTYTFAVAAEANGSALSTTPLMRDHINAVSIVNNKLTLQTSFSGPVDYTTVKAVN
jgi:flagellar basal-body rod modification protein FlgD